MQVQEAEPRIAVIRTSDRSNFKRCRRRWSWESGLRDHRKPTETPSYFWLGTGGHFALEDYHGHNHFGHPVEAAKAYTEASRLAHRANGYGLPDDWEEQSQLLYAILENYLLWLKNRDPFETVWIDGQPQVEITFHVPLPIKPPPGFDQVVYQFTLDRLVEVEGRFFILDWKFYKQFAQGDLDYDQQMSAYIWAASAAYDFEIAGGILVEFRKDIPNDPRILKNGSLSTAKNQKTTHGLYRQAIIDHFGTIDDATSAHRACLNDLASKEHADRDDFIRRTKTYRNDAQIRAEGSKILLEVEDMCNEDLPLYPNPTRDCSWDCSFRDICIMVDRDDDWRHQLEETTIVQEQEAGEWRNHLKVA